MACPYTAWLAVLPMLVACPGLDATAGDPPENNDSAGSSAPDSASCTPLDGVYQLVYRELSGDCGPQPNDTLEFNQGRLVQAPTHNCQAGGDAMISPCELRLDRTCNLSEGLSGSFVGRSNVSGSLREVGGSDQLTGEVDVAIVDTSGGSCEGTYAVSGVRVD